jgi:hypothetical protein
MVMDRCKRRRNRLKSALGRRRVSQSEDLLRCRFSLSRTVPSSLSRTVPSRTVPHGSHGSARLSRTVRTVCPARFARLKG